MESGDPSLVDVRSPAEFTGELLHAIGYPQEGAQRAGHVAGAKNIPVGHCRPPGRHLQAGRRAEGDSTKARASPRTSDEIIAYCRIGERSSHTWFVLTYLLGYDNVRNYDGSWTE